MSRGFRVWDKVYEEYTTDKVLLAPDGRVISRYGFDSCDSFLTVNDVVIEFDTGLKDKNDVKIYEGDILQIDDHILGDFEVIWHNLGWKIKRSVGFETLSVHKTEDIVVIGNIHENPELLEVENE